MHLLYCWRCDAEVPVLDEAESEELLVVHRAAIRAIQQYRAQRNVPLKGAKLGEFHRPAQLLYQRLSRQAGLEAPIVAFEHLLDHRASKFGPPCTSCGRPLRTPAAKLCASCGAKREV